MPIKCHWQDISKKYRPFMWIIRWWKNKQVLYIMQKVNSTNLSVSFSFNPNDAVLEYPNYPTWMASATKNVILQGF